jgi:hypothetical protein
MASRLQLEFVPTRADYFRHWMLSTWSSPNARLRLGIVALVVVAMGAASILSWIRLGTRFNWETALLAPGIIAAILLSKWLPFEMRLRASPGLLGKVTWVLDDEVLRIQSNGKETSTGWGDFVRASETTKDFGLQFGLASSTLLFIPRRAFTSPAHEEEFRQLLARKVPKSR